MDHENLPHKHDLWFEALAAQANETLENAGSDAAQRAFILSGLIGLLPAALAIAVIAYYAGWSASALMSAAAVVCLFTLAGLAAITARQNAIQRLYERLVHAKIDNALQARGLSRAEFDQAALSSLGPHAALRQFLLPLSAASAENETVIDHLIDRIRSI